MKSKKGLKTTLLVLLAVLVVFGAVLGGLLIYSKNYSIPEQAATIQNTTGLVQASGRSLYDAAGNRLELHGVNAGQILLQEGWMGPFSLEPMKNADGSYVKDGDGNIQYPEFTEEQFRQGLASNPNLAGHDLDELMKYYWNCFFTEEDFRIIKEELGLNTIRLPFYWRNILNDDYSLKSEEEAFGYLDWFMSMAAKYEIYIVLDLHGAPVTQNGYEHSGDYTDKPLLWDDQAAMDATAALWDYVSQHYTQAQPELGKWIATYDLLNEPTGSFDGSTNKACWELYDRIYDLMRENGDAHVITMEGCWSFHALPDPAQYGWENVQYEYHWYNWWSNILPYDLFYVYQDMNNIGRDYDVPVLIGEFTLFEDKEAWADALAMYDQRGYNWTIWNYKTTVTGWWTSSWGVYTCQMKAITEQEDTKCNVATCTYEEFIATCELTRTENCVTSTLYEVLMTYKEGK